ncbi:MAG: CDP-alcohol phosphatidyltransferase family protein, partial [Bacteroidetes bacterium]|nr:CDP-alcohol phosphatidyltransferase family protein [Bacteroidota bacterium]
MLESRKYVPSLFTILNAFCGLMSIINASHGLYEQAALFIIYASLFDMLDGIVARILRS